MRYSLLPERTSSHEPAGLTAETQRDQSLAFTGQRVLQRQIGVGLLKQLRRELWQKFFLDRVNQTQRSCWIKRKDGNVHLSQDTLQQGCRFGGSGVVLSQQAGQRVPLTRELTQS